MRWKPIIAAVDRSQEAVQAAAFAWNIAKAAGAQFHLVNVAREVLVPPTGGGPLVDTAEINRAIRDSNRMRTEAVLRHGPADEVAERLEVRVGNASAVLSQMARDSDAELLVLGGKRHARLARWLGGTTAHHLARMGDVPLLLVRGAPRDIRRVLAVVGLADRGAHVVEMARRLASLFDAALRVVYPVELLPTISVPPVQDDRAECLESRVAELDNRPPPTIVEPDVGTGMWDGRSLDTITEEVRAWGADVVVAGFGGKRWAGRTLLGSTVGGLLNHLPASLLIVPSSAG